MLALNTLAIGAASLFAVAAANHGSQFSRAHHHNPLLERSEHHLQKRFNGQATYYQTGLGACGIYNNPSDKIVAQNSAQFGSGYPGPNCFKWITICKGSNCHPAQITDECPTCDYGSLDLSQSLFEEFANTDDGVFQMTWTYNDGGSEPTTTKKPDPPQTTSSKKPDPPKTTWVPPTTTKEPEPTTTSKKHTSTPPPETTSTPEPTTSTSSSTSSAPTTTSTSEAQSTVSTTSVASTSASPSATPDTSSGSSSASSGSNWADMAQAMLAMGRLATVAHSA